MAGCQLSQGMEVELIFYILFTAWYSGICLESEHSGGGGPRILSLRPVWTTLSKTSPQENILDLAG
jgi:hypothetical protein